MRSRNLSLAALIIILLSANIQPGLSQLSESLYLLTDRDVYMAGEKISYRIWLKSSGGEKSEIAFLELWDAFGENVDKRVMKLEDGNTAGEFLLPGGLASGFYLIRAYTPYLRDLGAETFFLRKIMVMNPSLNAAFRFPSKENIRRVQRVTPGFFPEGGKLVSGIASRLFITSGNGKADPFEGALITNSLGDTLGFVEKIDQGTAYCDFMPDFPPCFLNMPGLYPAQRALIPGVERNSTLLKLLPEPGGAGFTVETTDTTVKLNRLRVDVFDVVRDSLIDSHPVGERIFHPFGEEKTKLYSFRLKDEGNEILSEVGFYRPVMEVFGIRTEMGKRIYKTREKVVVDISLSGVPEPVDPGMYLTVVVRKKMPSVFDNPGIDFSRVQDPASLLRPEWNSRDPLAGRALGSIYADRLQGVIYRLNEFPYTTAGKTEVTSIRGRIENVADPAGLPVYLSFPGDSTQLFIQRSGPGGIFQFPAFLANGNREIYLKTADSVRNGFLSIENPFYSGFEEEINWPDSVNEELISFAEGLYRSQVISNIYDTHKSGSQSTVPVPRLFDQHDFRLEMDNYVELPNMEEVFFEIVKQIMFFRNNGEPYVQIVDRVTNRTLGKNTLYILDGVPFTDPAPVFALPPTSVRDLNIIARRVFIGSENFDGIVIVNTRSGDFSVDGTGGSLVKQRFSFPQEGIRKSTPPEQAGITMPDHRTTLLWEPWLKPGNSAPAKLEFYTPDVEGAYEVVVTGYDPSSGRTGYTVYPFEVKDPR